MVVTSDQKMADHGQRLRDHGREDKYRHLELGFNFRMSEIAAAIGKVQLGHLKEWTEHRGNLATNYSKAFSHLQELGLITPTTKDHVSHAYHVYVIRYDPRDQLEQYLKSKGISSGIHYPIPIHKQPMFDGVYDGLELMATNRVVNEILSLPLYPSMTEDEQNYVIQHVVQFVEDQANLRVPDSASGIDSSWVDS